MNKNQEKQIYNLYEEFRGLPSSGPIVRNNQENDACTIYVLKALYEKSLHLSFTKQNIDEIATYIPAPPDEGIDIFVERSSGDESNFHVIQVKRSRLTESDLKTCFLTMKNTIKEFVKNTDNVKSESCRTILSKSTLDSGNVKNCKYYVVHDGDNSNDGTISTKDDEYVLNYENLDLWDQAHNDHVVKETLSFEPNEEVMNFDVSRENGSKALVCSINCYDLASLERKYYSTEAGRNILFGHNLRESLKNSKTYNGMKETIMTDPLNFWYYNNGITIVAEKVSQIKSDKGLEVIIEEFSIVNGAQTTSALGEILREANVNRDDALKENLKKAKVMARILNVVDTTAQHLISIYNNTQNPINSRDMVSNNKEQTTLNKRLLNEEYPQIYMEIRRGSVYPSTFNKHFTHRCTTNEELAQYAIAGFQLSPFKAKDKKASLFNNDYSQKEFLLNELYHSIFYYDETNPQNNGILHRKSKSEIDELLFVHQLYREANSYLRGYYQNRISENEDKLKDPSLSDQIRENSERAIKKLSQRKDTIGICMVYFITLYYMMDNQYGSVFAGKRYEYDNYYSDKTHRKDVVQNLGDFFLSKTVDILIDTANDNNKGSNMNNWVRSAGCEDAFTNTLLSELTSNISLETKYRDLMTKYKVVQIQ